jgi:branched-chain amino acid transport system ATP-binding protein
LIQASNLEAGYGQTRIVRGVDLEVHRGEVVVLLGPNGAGKTTTLLTLCGDLPAQGGEVRWLGDVTRSPMYSRVRSGLAFVMEERSVFMGMTLLENLKFARCDVDMALDLFPELKAHLRKEVRLLSGGQQQMLSLGRALSQRPALVVADELSLGLAPIVVNRLFEALRGAAEHGVGVLLVEQHVRKALQHADRAYVMRRGTIELSGTAGEITERLSEVEEAYLAGSASSL